MLSNSFETSNPESLKIGIKKYNVTWGGGSENVTYYLNDIIKKHDDNPIKRNEGEMSTRRKVSCETLPSISSTLHTCVFHTKFWRQKLQSYNATRKAVQFAI